MAAKSTAETRIAMNLRLGAIRGASPELGTTEKGKLADLILLNADALADITNKKINPYESAGPARAATDAMPKLGVMGTGLLFSADLFDFAQ